MSTPRDAFLQRVREALSQGNRPGDAAPLEPRGSTGYQGAGPDPVARFRDELTAAGGFPHLVADAGAAAEKVLALVKERSARRVLLGTGAVIGRLRLDERLRQLGVEVTVVTEAPEPSRDAFFNAEFGVSGADYLIAETGTVVVMARRDEPRSLSLLPPVHIVVTERSQILPDLFDLFERTSQGAGLPSSLTLITGPSKTGDIELKLVTGVHGPGELHVVLITS